MANVPLYNKRETINNKLLCDIAKMAPMDGEGCVALGKAGVGYLVYTKAEKVSLQIEKGKYTIYQVNASTGEITKKEKIRQLQGIFAPSDTVLNNIFWLRKED